MQQSLALKQSEVWKWPLLVAANLNSDSRVGLKRARLSQVAACRNYHDVMPLIFQLFTETSCSKPLMCPS